MYTARYKCIQNQRHFSKNTFKIEKHQCNWSFIFTEQRYGNHGAFLHAIAVLVTSIYITNMHKTNWLIMLLSMPSPLDSYTHMYIMFHMQFELGDSGKKMCKKGIPNEK